MEQQLMSRRSWLIIFCCAAISGTLINAQEPEVQVLVGEKTGYRGILQTPEENVSYWAFLGVRYADPLKRFQVSSRAEAPKGVVDALKEPPVCPQVSILNHSSVIGEEDCLFLNVFTPPVPELLQPDLPVVVFFHGGSFSYGAASWYRPHFLVPEGVILVVPQYRLGALGFLATGDEYFPGNLGLMDQVTALEWVQRYIKYFGGNPDRVTIMGHSAGGASVGLHMLSPLSKGLFSAAISLSGNALDPWVLQDEPTAFAFNLARQLNCSSSQGKFLHACLLDMPASQIVWAEQDLKVQRLVKGQLSEIAAGPVLQPSHDMRFLPPFLSASPLEALQKGQVNRVPYLLGTVKDEASGSLTKKYGSILANESAKHIVEQTMEQTELSPLAVALASELIHWEYFGEYVSETDAVKFAGISQLASDLLFKKGAFQMAQLWSQWADTYMYSFEYAGQPKLWKLLSPRLGDFMDQPVSHGDELPYLFPLSSSVPIPGDVLKFSWPSYSEQDKEIRYVITEFWTNFIKSGKPDVNGQWTPFSAVQPNTYVIGKNSRLEKSVNLKRIRLLNDLVPSLSSQVLQILAPAVFKVNNNVSTTTAEPVTHKAEPETPQALQQESAKLQQKQQDSRGSVDKKSLNLNQEEVIVSSSSIQIGSKPLGQPQLLNPASLRAN